MGSYESSRYVTGRKAYLCTRCQGSIPKGARHLTYQVGLMNSHRVCHTCSLLEDADTRPVYWCQAVMDERKR
jgi:hypothetical protein